MINNNKLVFDLIHFLTLLLILLLFPLITYGQSIPPSFQSIKWQKGPCIAYLGDVAEINVPAGYFFTDSSGTKDFMELIKETASGNILGVVISFAKRYYILFEFDAVRIYKRRRKGFIGCRGNTQVDKRRY